MGWHALTLSSYASALKVEETKRLLFWMFGAEEEEEEACGCVRGIKAACAGVHLGCVGREGGGRIWDSSVCV